LKSSIAPAYVFQLIPFVGIDAARPVDQRLDGTEQPVEDRSLALVDARHVGAERFREREQDAEEEPDLDVAVGRHVRTTPA
jgi:hypothetical protein